VHATKTDPAQEYYALIVDCGSDSSVKSDVLDQYNSLVKAGYEAVLAIRDVFPLTHGDIPRLRKGLAEKLPLAPVLPVFVLGVMEVESWFLAEHTHYPKVDAALTAAKIRSDLNFDPENGDMQSRVNPAADLRNAYQLVGKTYKKDRERVERTVNLLDYTRLYFDWPGKFGDFGILINAINTFLS
jgi:hypothetical protein